jgi:hypothetical protein
MKDCHWINSAVMDLDNEDRSLFWEPNQQKSSRWSVDDIDVAIDVCLDYILDRSLDITLTREISYGKDRVRSEIFDHLPVGGEAPEVGDAFLEWVTLPERNLWLR